MYCEIGKFATCFIFLTLIISGIEPMPKGNLPDYVQLCKKDDPQLNECLIKLMDAIRPKLAEGIPELKIPPIDPLFIPEVVISRGNNKGLMKAIGYNVTVTGGSNYKINHLRANVNDLEFDIGMSFPWLKYNALYDVNANILSLPIKGKGPMKGNVTDVTVNAILKGKAKTNKDGQKHVEFTSATVDVKVKNYYVKVERMFKDKPLNDALNQLLNDKNSEAVISAKPLVNKVAGTMILEMVNRIFINFDLDDAFL